MSVWLTSTNPFSRVLKETNYKALVTGSITESQYWVLEKERKKEFI